MRISPDVVPAVEAGSASKPKLLIVELWGIGDLVMATTLIARAVEVFDVVVVGKPHAAALLAPSFPQVQFVTFNAPWTVFRGKYHLWRWNWIQLFAVVGRLRREGFVHAVSVRRDPRDHLLMWLTGAKRRHGFAAKGSAAFLTDSLQHDEAQHRVENWREIGRSVGLRGIEAASPALEAQAYTSTDTATMTASGRALVCLHTGSRIAVRRWPEDHFREIIKRLRQQFDFHLVVIPDPDGYGASLADTADTFLPQIPLAQLVTTLGEADLVICNDSAPSHIAAACGRPVIAMFGPTQPAWFRPWGEQQKVIIRDICPLRPCFDYCAFAENYCLTKLLPEDAWPEIEQYAAEFMAAKIPTSLSRAPAAS